MKRKLVMKRLENMGEVRVNGQAAIEGGVEEKTNREAGKGKASLPPNPSE